MPHTAERQSVSEQLQRASDELRSFSGNAGEIAQELRELLAKEVELARAEVMEQVSLVSRVAGFGAAAVLLAGTALIFACVTLMFMLDTAMPAWVAALLTTLIVAGAAAVLGFTAMSLFKTIRPAPRRTLASLKEDITWARSQMRLSEK